MMDESDHHNMGPTVEVPHFEDSLSLSRRTLDPTS